MKATVFFKDGHTEKVIYSNYIIAFHVGICPKDGLYFDTTSGHYKFLQSNGCEEISMKGKLDRLCTPKNSYAFYKYNSDYGEWFVDESIDRIEFNTNG